MTKHTVTLKVTARAGRRIIGFGTRQMGETFVVPEDVAHALATDPGLEVVTPSRKSTPKVEPDPADAPEPDSGVKETNDNAR